METKKTDIQVYRKAIRVQRICDELRRQPTQHDIYDISEFGVAELLRRYGLQGAAKGLTPVDLLDIYRGLKRMGELAQEAEVVRSQSRVPPLLVRIRPRLWTVDQERRFRKRFIKSLERQRENRARQQREAAADARVERDSRHRRIVKMLEALA